MSIHDSGNMTINFAGLTQRHEYPYLSYLESSYNHFWNISGEIEDDSMTGIGLTRVSHISPDAVMNSFWNMSEISMTHSHTHTFSWCPFITCSHQCHTFLMVS